MEAIEPSRAQLRNPIKRYFLATRPAFLAAAFIPALLGIAWAYHIAGVCTADLAILTVIGAVLIHAGVNVLNDYYDDLNGTDAVNTDRIYPFTGGSRFIQNGVMSSGDTARFGFALLGAAVLIGLYLIHQSGIDLLYIGIAGLFIGWAYSAPPFSLNSHGLGEACIATGFGYLIPLGSAYIQTRHLDPSLLLIATPYAVLATCLLYINQFPDRLADAQAGKRHWVVRLEPDTSRWGYLILVLMGYSALGIAVFVLGMSAWLLLGLLGLPLSLVAAVGLIRHAREPARLLGSIRLTILALIVHGLALTGGVLLAG